jgi:hypothetical protein
LQAKTFTKIQTFFKPFRKAFTKPLRKVLSKTLSQKKKTCAKRKNSLSFKGRAQK